MSQAAGRLRVLSKCFNNLVILGERAAFYVVNR